jgi:hypothetical protein
LWQIHAFGEGNTRTTAVFTIKYLRTFSFEVENALFAQYSWYFRNALVRANFNDYQNKIYSTQEYLMKFFGNLLFNENNELKNRCLHIRYVAPENVNVTDVTDNDTVNTENLPVNGGQKMVVRNGGQKNLGVKLGVRLGVRLGVNQLKMIDIIQSNQNITIVEISQLLDISTTATENNIKKLKSLGILSREGADKNGYWQINNFDSEK